jgi:hypothetical protein
MPHPAAAVASLLSLFLGVACTSSPTEVGGEVPQGVLDFVASQPLPPVHSIGVSFRDGPTGVVVFAAAYGPLQDCWSGCFYDTAVGIQIQGRIGWWMADGLSATGLRRFDILSTDKVLFDVRFLSRFKKANPNLYTYFANYLSCDADTPVGITAALRAEAKRFELTCRSAF